MAAEDDFVYDRPGYCPICAGPVQFQAKYDWYRDWLFCSGCGSVPRERALALVLESTVSDWRDRRIHESSPEPRGISRKMRENCPQYTVTQYFPGQPLGEYVKGVRNENLEMLTFPDSSFDVVVTLDVMEHVNYPERVCQEVCRTLAAGGRYLFTVPTDKGRIETRRVALYRADGSVEHYDTPEYHGNPVSEDGALVTFRYGYDFAREIAEWANFDVQVHRFCRPHFGIMGEFTEVYECVKIA